MVLDLPKGTKDRDDIFSRMILEFGGLFVIDVVVVNDDDNADWLLLHVELVV